MSTAFRQEEYDQIAAHYVDSSVPRSETPDYATLLETQGWKDAKAAVVAVTKKLPLERTTASPAAFKKGLEAALQRRREPKVFDVKPAAFRDAATKLLGVKVVSETPPVYDEVLVTVAGRTTGEKIDTLLADGTLSRRPSDAAFERGMADALMHVWTKARTGNLYPRVIQDVFPGATAKVLSTASFVALLREMMRSRKLVPKAVLLKYGVAKTPTDESFITKMRSAHVASLEGNWDPEEVSPLEDVLAEADRKFPASAPEPSRKTNTTVVWTDRARWILLRMLVGPATLGMLEEYPKVTMQYVRDATLRRKNKRYIIETIKKIVPDARLTTLDAIVAIVGKDVRIRGRKCTVAGCDKGPRTPGDAGGPDIPSPGESHTETGLCLWHSLASRVGSWKAPSKMEKGEVKAAKDALVDDLVARYEDGEWATCAWTGAAIFSDDEFQLDHLMPQSQDRTLMYNPLNVVFVHGVMNKGRGEMDARVFYDTIVRLSTSLLAGEAGLPEGFPPPKRVRAIERLEALEAELGIDAE